MCHSSRVDTDGRPGSTVPAGIGARGSAQRRRGLLGAEVPTTSTGMVLRELTSLAIVVQAVWILASPDLWPTNLDRRSPARPSPCPCSPGPWLLLLQYGGAARQRRWARYADVAAVALAVAGHRRHGRGHGLMGRGLLAGCAVRRASSAPSSRCGSRSSWSGCSRSLTLDPVLDYSRAASPVGAPASGVAAYVAVIGGVHHRGPARPRGQCPRGWTTTRPVATRSSVSSGWSRASSGAMRRQERLLHETVLNTLTAIARGGLARHRGRRIGAGAALPSRPSTCCPISSPAPRRSSRRSPSRPSGT